MAIMASRGRLSYKNSSGVGIRDFLFLFALGLQFISAETTTIDLAMSRHRNVYNESLKQFSA